MESGDHLEYMHESFGSCVQVLTKDQSEAGAVDQAHRLADGYNRQFLRVLRQLRDLRRYAPVVIQNAQQVNVGNQQLNVSG